MDLESLLNENRDKSESELLEQLADMTARQKQSGELNNSKMEEIYELLSPMLSESQKKRMQEVIAAMKGV